MAKDKIKKAEIREETGLAPFCEKMIFWLIMAAVFIIPLFFNISSYDQFEMPKLTVLRVLTSVMLGLWAIKILERGKIEWLHTPLDLPMLAWAGFNILTTFTSFAPSLSFRGEYENFAGSLSNLNYVALYFIVTQNIKTRKQVFAINTSLLLTGLMTGLYSLAQYTGHDIIQWNSDSMIKGRYFASMGNPNFLGALLIMIIPVNISYFLTALGQKKKLFAGLLAAVFALLYFSLFGTQSRGPFLGFVFSILVFLAYGVYRAYSGAASLLDPAGRTSGAVISLMIKKYARQIAVIIAVLFIAAALSATLGRNSTKRLWESFTDIKGSLQVSRLHIWLPSLKIIEENPLLGTGVDTYKTVFPKYEGTNFAYIDGANVSSRTAHDEPLNIAATMGLPALGIYFLLLFAYSRMWLRGFRRIAEYDYKMLSLAMFAAFVAYFVQNIFSFGVCAINTALYLFMGFHFLMYNEFYAARRSTIILFNPASSGTAKALLQALSVFLACVLIFKSCSIFAADVAYNRGKIIGSVYNNWKDAITEHIKSVKMEPGEVKYHVYLGLAYERYAMTLQDKDQQTTLMDESIKEYREGVVLNPGNAYYWGNLGRAYAFEFQLKKDQPDFEQAVKNYETAVQRAPVTGLFYNNLIDLYLQVGMVDRVFPLLSKLDLLDKNLAAAAHFMVGNLAFTKKDFALAEDEYKKTIEMKPDIFQAYHNLGVVFAARKDKANAKFYLEKFIEMAPTSDMVPNAKKILNGLR
jgi:O-antigen ligase